jgi:hypothetical protein
LGSLTRKIAVLATLALALALLGAASSGGASSGSLAVKGKASKAKSCKKSAKRHCKRKKRPPNPYLEGQPCVPAQAKAYARYDFLCLPQPQPDGTMQYQLVKSLA